MLRLADAVVAAVVAARAGAGAAISRAAQSATRWLRSVAAHAVEAQMHAYNDVLHAKDKRDPRGYIIPADQPDFLTAVKFVNTLRHVGVYVDQATAPFTVAGKQYPAGSFVIKNNQAARAHVLDMMEPQDHPNDFAYPGGPPRRPYDNAGWTLAYEMGVKFDRVLDALRRAEHEADSRHRARQAARRHGRRRPRTPRAT